MAKHRWIPITEQAPPAINSDNSTDIVDVKYEDDSIGEGFFRNKSWESIDCDKIITHWKPKTWIV